MAEALDDVIRKSPVRAMPGRYAVVRCADLPAGSGYFMVTRDSDEVTVIVEESELSQLPALGHEGGYRLVEIRVAVPFQGVGLLAAVTQALAAAGLSVLVVSTYSKDYLLLRDESLAVGLQTLSEVGFPVVDP
jgi:hypothetical protein